MKLRFDKVIIMNLFSVIMLMWCSIAAEKTSIDMVEDAFAEFKEEDIRFLFWQKTNHTDYITTHYNRKGSIDMKGIRSSGFSSSLNTVGKFCFELTIYLIYVMVNYVIFFLQSSLMAGR